MKIVEMSKITILNNLHLILVHIGKNCFANTYKIVEMSKKLLLISTIFHLLALSRVLRR